jgi:hypothetical protein
MAALWAGHLNRPVCPLWVISGQTIAGQNLALSAVTPKADKMLRYRDCPLSAKSRHRAAVSVRQLLQGRDQ